MPLPGFLTDVQLQDKLEARLHVAQGTLSRDDSADWAEIISDANEAAYNDIQSALLKRGLTQTQVDSWDRGAEYQRDIGLYWCLVNGASLHDFDFKIVNALDRRKELCTVELYADGVAITPPDPPSEGLVTTGALDTSTDLFRTDPFDVRRGQITRW